MGGTLEIVLFVINWLMFDTAYTHSYLEFSWVSRLQDQHEVDYTFFLDRFPFFFFSADTAQFRNTDSQRWKPRDWGLLEIEGIVSLKRNQTSENKPFQISSGQIGKAARKRITQRRLRGTLLVCHPLREAHTLSLAGLHLSSLGCALQSTQLIYIIQVRQAQLGSGFLWLGPSKNSILNQLRKQDQRNSK